MHTTEEINEAIQREIDIAADVYDLEYIDNIEFSHRADFGGLCTWRFTHLSAPAAVQAMVSDAIFHRLDVFAKASVHIVSQWANANPPQHAGLRRMLLDRTATIIEVPPDFREPQGGPIVIPRDDGSKDVIHMNWLSGLECFAGYHKGTNRLFVERI